MNSALDSVARAEFPTSDHEAQYKPNDSWDFIGTSTSVNTQGWTSQPVEQETPEEEAPETTEPTTPTEPTEPTEPDEETPSEEPDPTPEEPAGPDTGEDPQPGGENQGSSDPAPAQ